MSDRGRDRKRRRRADQHARGRGEKEKETSTKRWQIKRRPPPSLSTTTSSSSSTTSGPTPTATSGSVKEIPGYYYDPRLNRYFKKDPLRPQPAHTLPLCSPTPATPAPPARRRPGVPRAQDTFLYGRERGLLSPAAFRRHSIQRLASHWQPLRYERPATNTSHDPLDSMCVKEIALNQEHSLLLLELEGGLCTLEACGLKCNKEERGGGDLSMMFFNSRLWHRLSSPISSLSWAPASSGGQPPLFVIGTLGGHSRPGSADVYDIRFTRQASLTLTKGSLWCTEWKPQCTHVALGISQGALLFDITTSKFTRMLTGKSDVLAQCFEPTGNILFNASRDGKVRGVDLRADPKEARDGSHHPILYDSSPVCCVRSLSDGNYLMTSSFGGKLQRWDRRLTRPVMSFKEHSNQFSLLSFTVVGDYSLVLAGGDDKLLRVWDLKSGHLLQQIQPSTQHIIKSVAFGDNWKLARDGVVGQGFLPAIILPSLDCFSFALCMKQR